MPFSNVVDFEFGILDVAKQSEFNDAPVEAWLLSTNMLLVPTFQPPPTSLGRNQSQFERLQFLLSVNDEDQHQRSQVQFRRASSQFEPKVVTKDRKGHDANDTFDLFGGEIVVEGRSQDCATKEHSAPSEPSTTGIVPASKVKATVLEPSKKFKQLASFLDNEMGTETVKRGQKKEGHAATIVPVGAPEKGSEQSQKRARRHEQGAPEDVVFESSDFVGIEKFCRNAGGSTDGLRAFVNKVQNSATVSIAVLFQCLSTNHCTTTVKYCTQSSSCRHWNCTCDRHVRSTYVAENVMGMVVRIPAERETLYFLPLMDCLDPRNPAAVVPSSSVKRKLLPMQCGSSLQDRVDALREVFAGARAEKILFNAQVALMPLLQLIGLHPGTLKTHTNATSGSQGAASDTVQPGGRYCLQLMSNLFDPRLGAYMCDSDISEAQLELESLFDKYPHVRANVTGATETPGSWGASSAVASTSQAVQGRIAIPNHDLMGLGSVARAVQRLKGELNSLLGLHSVLAAEMAKLGIARIFQEIEMPMTCLLAAIEHCGVVVDVDFLNQQRGLVTQKINAIETEIFAAVAPAPPFNVASPEQVSHVLFEVLRLPPPAQTSKKGKHHSTSEEDLLRIRHCHPVVDLILAYRALAKISTTYVDGLRPFIVKESAELHQFLHPTATGAAAAVAACEFDSRDQQRAESFMDGVETNVFAVLMNSARSAASAAQTGAQQEHRIHACWQQTVVRTGRLSCTKPNLQNIPNKQNVAGMQVNMRSAFKASRGCVLVSADYSQIEMRVLAHLCQDSVLLGLFRQAEGYDIYRHLAARIFRKQVADVAEDERTKAKVICLGVLYGMGPQAAAAKLSISVEAASRITQTFFDNFKQIKAWIQQIKAQAKQHGCVRTLLGRLRHLPDLRSPDPAKSSYAERQAVNSVIQGTASDLIKYAMINVDRQLALHWPVSLPAPRALMQIHDELIYEVSTEEPQCVGRFTVLLHGAMEEQVVAALKLSVPLVANVHTGLSWGDIDS